MPHRRQRLAAALSLALASLGTFGCSSSEPLSGAALDQKFESIALGRASIEFPCPQSELTAQALGGYAYRVTGCGAYATYECDYDDAQGNKQSSGGADDNFWIYTCDRAAQDDPSRADAGP